MTSILRILLILFSFNCISSSNVFLQDLILFPTEIKSNLVRVKSLLVKQNSYSLLLVGENNNFDAKFIFTPTYKVEKRNKVDFIYINITNLNSKPIYVIGGFNDIRRNSGSLLIKPKSKDVLKILITSNSSLNKKFNMKGSLAEGITTFPEVKDSLENVHILFDNLSKGDSILIDTVKIVRQRSDFDFFKPISDEYGQLNVNNYPGKIINDSDLLNDKSKENSILIKGSRQNFNFYSYEKGPTLKGTGSFRTVKYENKWWLVDPRGKLFWSRGINCVNIDETTNLKNRSFLLSGFKDGTDSNMNFLKLNLRKKYGESYDYKYKNIISNRFKSWGINTYGNWSSPDFYLKTGIPYTCNLVSFYFNGFKFPDPYSNKFQEYLISQIHNNYKIQAKDPLCIGFFIDNELPWLNAKNIIWEASVDQPAKLKFIEFLKSKYESIDNINRYWKTSFVSFDDILHQRKLVNSAEKDTNEFLKKLATQYFKICKQIISQQTSNKLYLGCRFDFQYYPDDKRFYEIVEISSKFCDVVSFNRYRYIARDLVPHDNLDFPIIIGEFHFGSLDNGSINPGFLYTQSQYSRSQAYQWYITQCLENKYIVGAHWFQLFDQPITGRYDGENAQIGFISITDKPYSELVKASRSLDSLQYLIRFKTN